MTDVNINDGDAEFFAMAQNENNSVEIQVTENGSDSSIVIINIYPE